LSARSRPRASAISTFTRPSLKYMLSGTSVSLSRAPSVQRVDLPRWRRLALANPTPSGPPRVPEMDAPMSHACPDVHVGLCELNVRRAQTSPCPRDDACLDALDELYRGAPTVLGNELGRSAWPPPECRDAQSSGSAEARRAIS
jgi:hypothetical protein